MTTKSLLRYTIGPVSSSGFDILEESIRYIRNIYPELEIVICHNQLNEEQIHSLEQLEVPLYTQKHECLLQSPTGEQWKLYPPRLNPNGYEIVIDNDIILTERIPEIDEFLTSSKTLVMSAVYRAYGQFAKYVPENLYINSGIYGMPPGFDFEKKIKLLTRKVENWSERFDEQGLVATCLGNYKHITIPMSEVLPLGENSEWRPGKGYHFIDANKSEFHSGWEGYKLGVHSSVQ